MLSDPGSCSLSIYAAENQQRPDQEGYVGHRDHQGDRRCHDRGVAGGFVEDGWKKLSTEALIETSLSSLVSKGE